MAHLLPYPELSEGLLRALEERFSSGFVDSLRPGKFTDSELWFHLGARHVVQHLKEVYQDQQGGKDVRSEGP